MKQSKVAQGRKVFPPPPKFVIHRNREQVDRQNNQELIMAHPLLWITCRRHYCTPVPRNGVCVHFSSMPRQP
jgi:hypothetical protein